MLTLGVQENKVWLGNGFHAGNAYFRVVDTADVVKYAIGVFDDSTGIVKFRNCCWFTNIEHGRRHEPLSLMTEADNIKFSKHKEVKGIGYKRYDNYDAIEIPYTDAIPSDYRGVMGVPISFLDKYCPEQFEILGITKTWFGGANKVYPEQIQVDKHGKRSRVTKLNDGATIELSEIPNGDTYYIVNEKMYQQVYARVLIRQKRDSRSCRE